MVGLAVVIGIVVVAGIALLLVPGTWVGINDYTVKVQVTLSESCLIVCSYSVQSVNPTVVGPVTGWTSLLSFVDPSALGIAGPCLSCQYTLTVTLAGQTATLGETKFISNLLNFAYTDVATVGFASVPAGNHPIGVTLTLNGQQIATGSGSVCVGC